MMRTCFYCGRTGLRGFWTQIRLYPEPNRTMCTNTTACRRRQMQKGLIPRG